MAKVAVILPAAGAGERFGGKVKKPFAQIDSRPIFIRCVELFLNRKDVVQTIITVAPDDYDVVKEKYAANIMFMGLKLVKGGATRFESVRAALGNTDEQADLVCIHDAVRPCVLESWIDQVFKKAEETGAAILAAPLNGTIKRVKTKDHTIEQTVNREGLYEAQTPQVFRRDLILKAFADMPADFKPTDDAQVVERFGHPVAIVPTDVRNIKITTPGDMSLAGAILKEIARDAKKAGPLRAFEEAQW
jgi:2-C-methyl-D-erythritol 4-phosphate cytidylyltransferase